MKITVLSGKGGTGKTTVATNLALSLTNVQFLDADVEEPNSYIFIRPDFGEEYQQVLRKVPIIDQNKCRACRSCVDFCEYNALVLLGEEVLIIKEMCHSCGGCKYICPKEAIREEDKEVGKIRVDKSVAGMEFWQGELNIGEASAVPVIEALNQKVSEDKTVIIDAPPGTTCPTIAAISDANYCILVTEPTPFGLHDLKMAVEVVKELGKPCGIIINRSEEDADKLIEDYASNEGISILTKIPFKREIASLYSQGTPFVEEMPEWKENFQEVFTKIKQVVG
ncbi:MinD superfamily P-loop ATPase [Orenia metallireducens]|jgi:MinD superfamily P-loop ATPase|uniref:ATP-binding protein n=1 Tax=Orenia metallireducens TaxID=1413210 RepID=UPI000D04D5CD|nr:ATP-binding protein [Orenia metallireducens]PRX24195.1 MinD superfamily P-loop ATPase [Orenia metallireducens]